MNFLDKQFGRLGNRMFQMAYIYAQMREGATPDIYLQNPIYFEKYSDEIRQLFGDGIERNFKIAIHVRRGDYLTTYSHFYVNLTETDYYQKAMAKFPNEQFIVFSDDIEWCKQSDLFKQVYADYGHEVQEQFEFSEGKTAEQDLKLMAGCKGAIIANSSLSWWGGFLGDKDKKVIYPQKWFKDGVQRIGFPKGWQCV